MDTSSCICYDLNINNILGAQPYIIIRETMGILSAVTSGILFIPDIIISCKTKGRRTHDFKFLILFLLGAIFWLIYAILIYSISTIILEIFLIINITIILIMKCIYYYHQRRLRLMSSNNDTIVEDAI
uniref:PQ loop repeat protein n=1 Tax=viral metagenome TaxID=1070528 RepID=A0A6C0B660_9ZZZZ